MPPIQFTDGAVGAGGLGSGANGATAMPAAIALAANFVTVTNTGARTGTAVPELYLGLPSLPGVPQPPRQLKAFAKVKLAPGASARVSSR